MKKYLLLLLISAFGFSQTNPTSFSKIKVMNATKNNGATRVVVQDSITKEYHWQLASSFSGGGGGGDLQSTLDAGNFAEVDGGFSNITLLGGSIANRTFDVALSDGDDIFSGYAAHYGYASMFSGTADKEGGFEIVNGLVHFYQSDTFAGEQTNIEINTPTVTSTINFPAPTTAGTHTLPISVNGEFADSAGNITVSGGGSQDLQSVIDTGDYAEKDSGDSYVELLAGTIGSRYISMAIDGGAINMTNNSAEIGSFMPTGPGGVINFTNGITRISQTDPTGTHTTDTYFTTPVADVVLNFPAKTVGTYTIATLDDITGGSIVPIEVDNTLKFATNNGPNNVTSNTAFGQTALRYVDSFSFSNSAFGHNAGNSILDGGANTAVGQYALSDATAGTQTSNTAIGQSALRNATGSYNTAVGQSASHNKTSGSNDTSIGYGSLYNSTGSDNTAIGTFSGRYIADGSTALSTVDNSIFIGSGTKAAANSQTNQIVIGYNAIGAGSNTTTIGNSSVVKTIIRGVVNTPKTYTVATLPAGVLGDRTIVTDATSPTYLGALTGGGAVVCPVFYNGTIWVSN